MVLLGMTAYFASVTQAPITAFIIILEITGRQSLPVPLIAASVIAAAVSRMICPVSLYHALAKTLLKRQSTFIPTKTNRPYPGTLSPTKCKRVHLDAGD